MSQSTSEPKTSQGPFQNLILGVLLIAIVGIPLCVTTLVNDGEDKWFLIRVLGPVLGIILILHRTGRRIESQPLDALAVFTLAWLAVMAISLAGTTNMGMSIAVITRQIGLLSFFFLVRYYAKDTIAVRLFIGALVLVGLATSIYGVVQHFGYDFIQWQQHTEVPIERGVSFMGHATFAASVLIMLIPLAIAFAINTPGKLIKAILLFTGLVMLYHLSFSGARVATVALFLACAAGIVACWISAVYNKSGTPTTRVRPKTVIVLLVVIAIAGSVFVNRAWSLKGSDVLGLLEGGMAQRVYAWETANRVFLANPVNGIGIGNYEVVSPAYWNIVEASRFAQFQRALHQPHNEYFEAAAEAGLPGVAALLGIVVFGLVQCLYRSRLPRILAAGIFTAILASALDAFFLFPWQVPESGLVFWVLLGIVSGQSESPESFDALSPEPEVSPS